MRRRVAKEAKRDAKATIGRGNFPNISARAGEGDCLLSTFQLYVEDSCGMFGGNTQKEHSVSLGHRYDTDISLFFREVACISMPPAYRFVGIYDYDSKCIAWGKGVAVICPRYTAGI